MDARVKPGHDAEFFARAFFPDPNFKQPSAIARIVEGAGYACFPFSVSHEGNGAHPISGLPEIGHV
jgi:hypothetical protein